ncbi:hypothetical protein QBZ16_005133 [Prototheca wickerhamii]|uniref:Elongator complex protein 1 n=1 Tax=Prototheca wickerhamii TaxID=3111 RepID=A0AAD9MJQ4_PROWI|nr:hypothetical protein QBZ16_005133 [Prototheca wickerhamii]
MNNLQTLEFFRAGVQGQQVVHTCHDEDAGRLIILRADGTVDTLSLNDCQVETVTTGVLVEEPRACSAFLWAPELEAVLVCSRSPDVPSIQLLHLPADQRDAWVEEIGGVEGGVQAAAWSPDGQRLVLVTGRGQVLVMDEGWTPVSEQSLPGNAPVGSASVEWRADGACFAVASAPDVQASHSLTVWDGASGELACLGEALPGMTNLLSWQPNGRHLYAVQRVAAPGDNCATGDPNPDRAEAASALHTHVAAWKREARRREAAAAAARKERGDAACPHRVVLFERNGLQHGGFDVPDEREGCRVSGIAWSPDAEVLALVSEAAAGGATEHSSPKASSLSVSLQLWHRSNWHWYCKSERRWPACSVVDAVPYAQRPSHLHWDVRGLALYVLGPRGCYARWEGHWAPDRSVLGTVAQVDGRRLQLTPLRHSAEPPPAATAEAVLPAAALCCALHAAPAAPEGAAVCLCDGRVALAHAAEHDDWAAACRDGRGLPASVSAQPILSPEETVRLKRCCWLPGGRALALVLGASQAVGNDRVAVAVRSSGDDVFERLPGETLRLPGSVLAACDDILELHDGELVRLELAGDRLDIASALAQPGTSRLPVPCPTLCALPTGVFGLSRQGELWRAGAPSRDQALVAQSVTSVCTRPGSARRGGAWLLFTTRDEQLHCVRPDAASPKSAAPAPALRRRIEAGAVLVAAPPGVDRVVLALPRGNLEIVAPRALVLSSLATLLRRGDFRAAWSLAVEQRVDLNLLVDAHWPRFLSRADAFVRALDGDQAVADVLAALRPGSVLAPGGLYANVPGFVDEEADEMETVVAGEEDSVSASAPIGASNGALSSDEAAQSRSNIDDKVALVCAAVRGALGDASSSASPSAPRFLRTLLVSHARQGDLAAALALLKRAKEAQERGAGVAPDRARVSAEDGLRHLMLTTPPRELYAAALGTYELDLAYFVVSHSQLDPAEYLQELGAFAAIASEPLRRAAIDEHLRRHESALRHYLLAGTPKAEAAALDLAQRHKLLRTLLRLCDGEGEEGGRDTSAGAAAGETLALNGQEPGRASRLAALRTATLARHAESLAAQGRHEDAGLAFIAAGDPASALAAYRQGGCWQQALAVAPRAGVAGPEATRSLALELADELAEARRPAEAARLRVEFARDVDGAVALLAAGGEWREGLRLAEAHARPDLVRRVLAPAAAVRASEALADARENAERVAKYRERLRHLSARRRALAAALEDDDEAADEDAVLDDALSTISTAVSGLSVYSSASTAARSGATTAASSSASTVGGKRRQSAKSRRKAASRGRVRQGSPEEERQLATVLLDLAPGAALLAEMGQLLELLVVLGHEPDARRLQRALGALCAAQDEAADEVLADPPPGMRAPDAALPSDELRWRVACARAQAGAVGWKCDILRD